MMGHLQYGLLIIWAWLLAVLFSVYIIGLKFAYTYPSYIKLQNGGIAT